MAKGLRSSSKKGNRTKLRAKVFAPVENARMERIHQKLLETAQQPKPAQPEKKEMEVDSAEDAAPKDASLPKDMEIDGVDAAAAAAAPKGKPKDRKAMRKAKKDLRRKPKNSISFPKTRGKGALKPHSESRVRKRVT